MAQPFLERGDEGPVVSAAQLALAALGFDVGSVNGIFDDATAAAVMSFQENQGLAVTGSVDDETWAALGGQSFDPSERTEIGPEEAPSIARAVFFSSDIDGYLQDLGIDSTTIIDDDDPVS